MINLRNSKSASKFEAFMTDENTDNEQLQPQIKIPRAEGQSHIDAAEEYFGCPATPSSELPQEAPSEEYLIEIE